MPKQEKIIGTPVIYGHTAKAKIKAGDKIGEFTVVGFSKRRGVLSIEMMPIKPIKSVKILGDAKIGSTVFFEK